MLKFMVLLVESMVLFVSGDHRLQSPMYASSYVVIFTHIEAAVN